MTFDQEGFCRACLVKYEEPTELLQYTERNRRLFVYCTSLQVKRTDVVTFQLCKDCYMNMKMSCRFKKLCRTSDKKLRNFLALKDVGDSLDFCTFLKNTDNTVTFQLPLLSGSSTPANRKDEDNESTCTSIRNFMTDILQGEEMPDAEARIIREVIEEEADVLDDSLDSQWLQDDVSMDTDFRLDFSFSPFSTPRPINNDHCYTPKKLDNIKPIDILPYFPENHEIKSLTQDVPTGYEATVKTNQDAYNRHDADNIENHTDLTNIDLETNRSALQGKKHLNFYTEGFIIEPSLTNGDVQKMCTIDRNLEEALKNKDSKEFSLDDILVSPRVLPGVSAASTPTIHNILFGDKLDANVDRPDEQQTEQCIEEYEYAQGDDMKTLDDYLKSYTADDKECQLEIDEDIEKLLDTVEYDLDKGYCHQCSKQYRSTKALKIHLNKYHHVVLTANRNDYIRDYKYRMRMCEVCSEQMPTYTYYRHIKLHSKPKPQTTFSCAHCKVSCTSKARLAQHLQTHGFVLFDNKKTKRFVCTTCGAAVNGVTNFKTHMARHTQNYTKTCSECGKGFYKASDLKDHYRTHTGDLPFSCDHCPKMFSRRATLVKHIKLHSLLAEKRYKCDNCETQFYKRSTLTAHKKRSIYCRRIRKAKAREEARNNKIK